MRYLCILAFTVSLASPAAARKHQRRPNPAPVKTRPVEVAHAAPPPARGHAAAQADDDEVPGQKHKK
jgi:hypothetical protein